MLLAYECATRTAVFMMLNFEDTLTSLSAAIRIRMSESERSESWGRESKTEANL